MSRYRAVIFDLGGVVMGSPLHAIAAYERDEGVPEGFVNRLVVETGREGSWSRLERGELDLESFYPLFDRECLDAGHPLSGREMMARMAEVAQPRPAMLDAIRAIRTRGLRTGALTNNWTTEDSSGAGSALAPHFDVVVESSVVGLRKPDPRIYELACEQLEVAARDAVFLDDIGRNLKPARAMGMATIKVDEPGTALRELAEVLGFALDAA